MKQLPLVDHPKGDGLPPVRGSNLSAAHTTQAKPTQRVEALRRVCRFPGIVSALRSAVDPSRLTQRKTMAYVVTEPCHDCKYTDCVTVCPCDCFYQDEHMLYIDPDHCIDCDACAPECPVSAIFLDADVPAHWRQYIELNAQRVASLKNCQGHITQKQPPLLRSGCKTPP
jgi:ferredoxin